jgi:hypothetical protein
MVEGNGGLRRWWRDLVEGFGGGVGGGIWWREIIYWWRVMVEALEEGFDGG